MQGSLPAGVLLSREALERAAQLTARAGAWLVMDNTYEHFVYEGLQHHCISAPHIIHLFSFSKVGKSFPTEHALFSRLYPLQHAMPSLTQQRLHLMSPAECDPPSLSHCNGLHTVK